MNNLFKATFTLVVLSFSQLAFADKDTQNLIGGYGSSDPAFQILVKRPVDGPLIIAQDNSQLLYVPFPTNPFTIEQTLKSLSQFFVPAIVPDQSQLMESNRLSFGPPGTPPPSGPNYWKAGAQAPADTEKQRQSAPFANIDVNSLLGPLVYKDDQKKTAENFINAASGQSTPFNTVDLVDLAKQRNAQNPNSPPTTAAALATTPNTDVAKYLASLRTYATLQAVGMSNLYQFYAERLPSNVDEQQNKVLADALKGINMPNASQLQVENYMATRRLTDPQWVASLSNDSPAALLRQIAILLAENLLMSYNNHMATERLTVTMTMLELQQAATTRQMLDQTASSFNKAGGAPGPSGAP